MKKISLFLAILSLASGMNAIGGGEVKAGEIETMILGENSDGTITPNMMDSRFKIAEISPEIGEMTVKFTVEDKNLKPGLWAFATYDYEKMTEAEADKAWVESVTLGAVRPEWTDIFCWFSGFMGLGINTTEYENRFFVSTNDKLEAGLTMSVTDVAYFRVKIGGDSSPTNGTWLIGKIDYRNCIHDAGYTGSCQAVTNAETGEIIYSADGSGEIKKVMTWPEEWGNLTRERYEILEGKVNSWLDAGELTEEERQEFEDETAVIKRALEGSTGVDDLAEALAILEKRVSGEVDEEAPGSGTGSGNGGAGDQDNLGSQGTVVIPGGAEQGDGVVNDVTQGGETEGGASGTAGTVAGSGPITEASVGVVGAVAMTAGVRDDDMEESDNEAGNNMVASGNETVKDRNGGGQVEVPELGGAQQGWKGWPWLIIVLSAAGVTGWWVWRAFGKKKNSRR